MQAPKWVRLSPIWYYQGSCRQCYHRRAGPVSNNEPFEEAKLCQAMVNIRKYFGLSNIHRYSRCSFLHIVAVSSSIMIWDSSKTGYEEKLQHCFQPQKISEKYPPGDSFLFLPHQDPLNPRLAPHLWHAWREPCLTLGLGPVVSDVALGCALKASRHSVKLVTCFQGFSM